MVRPRENSFVPVIYTCRCGRERARIQRPPKSVPNNYYLQITFNQTPPCTRSMVGSFRPTGSYKNGGRTNCENASRRRRMRGRSV